MHIHFITRKHQLWDNAVEHIRKVYQHAYGADITVFAPEMAVGLDITGNVICVAGIRCSNSGFFSDQYLDTAIEQAVSKELGITLSNNEIIEVTGMACSSPIASLTLLDALAHRARSQGKKVGICTVTKKLRMMFKRSGVPLIEIKPALRESVESGESWGSYYEADPWVCIVPDQVGNKSLDIVTFSPRNKISSKCQEAVYV